jgi:hypothetical protein
MIEIARLLPNGCRACGVECVDGGYAWYGGPYCSKKCYATLFDNCDDCGQWNMTVVENEKEHGEHICRDCRMKKHNLTTQTIVMKFPRQCRRR